MKNEAFLHTQPITMSFQGAPNRCFPPNANQKLLPQRSRSPAFFPSKRGKKEGETRAVLPLQHETGGDSRKQNPWKSVDNRMPQSNWSEEKMGQWMIRRVLYFFATLLYRLLRAPSRENLQFTVQVVRCVQGLTTSQGVLLQASSHLLELWESNPPSLFAPRGLHVILAVFQKQGWRYNLNQSALTHQPDYFGVSMEQMVSAVFWLRGETEIMQRALQEEEEGAGESSSSSLSTFWRLSFESPQQAFALLSESCSKEEKNE